LVRCRRSIRAGSGHSRKLAPFSTISRTGFPEADLIGAASLCEETEFNRWSAFLVADLHSAFFPLFVAGAL